MHVSNGLVSPMYIRRYEIDEKPRANFGENVQHFGESTATTGSTIVKATIAGGGILGLGYVMKNPEAIVKRFPKLKTPVEVTSKLVNKAKNLATSGLNKVKTSKIGKAVAEEAAPFTKKVAGLLEKVPGKYKAAAGIVAGLITLGGVYKAGKVDEKHENRVMLRHSFEG